MEAIMRDCLYILLAVFVIFLFGMLYSAYAEEVTFGGDIERIQYRVIDGDTFVLHVGAPQEVTLRLNGADAPEKRQKCFRRDGSEFPCAEEARRALLEMLERGSQLKCVQVGMSYNRPVVRCEIDGKDIAYELISRGLAVHDSQYTSGHYRMRLSMVEVIAWWQGLGVWQDPKFQEPKQWRREH